MGTGQNLEFGKMGKLQERENLVMKVPILMGKQCPDL
jgi:hypothetical protein